VLVGGRQGKGGKMSASAANTAIYVSDTAKQVKDKINKYAFSGGQETAELQRQLGANIQVRQESKHCILVPICHTLTDPCRPGMTMTMMMMMMMMMMMIVVVSCRWTCRTST
jgi:hypothetical protein